MSKTNAYLRILQQSMKIVFKREQLFTFNFVGLNGFRQILYTKDVQ